MMARNWEHDDLPKRYKRQVKKIPKKKGRQRIANNPKIIDGIKFASTAEASRYAELKLLQDKNIIQGLYLQPRFVLQPKFEYHGTKYQAIIYTADFLYVEGEFLMIEEFKSTWSAEQAEYVRKKKTFLYRLKQAVIMNDIMLPYTKAFRAKAAKLYPQGVLEQLENKIRWVKIANVRFKEVVR